MGPTSKRLNAEPTRRIMRFGVRSFAFLLAGSACLTALTIASSPAFAQSSAQLVGLSKPDPNALLLLQADELIYDQDNNTVTAQGSVRIDYDGTRLIAERVIYREEAARLIATGNVEVLQPDGTRTFADEIDITDDFRDGFVNSLRILTPDKTRFSAESAVREDGRLTTFNNGLYTACNECVSKEGRPLWQIKAKRVIWNGEEKLIRFEQARFEFMGVPLAYIPVFTTADPTVKRKTGFLQPSFSYSNQLGFGASVPYFINLAPNRDLKITGTGYTRQGFLAEAEYRHRLQNGTFTLKTAGIHQFSPGAFASTRIDSTVRNRGMVGTTGAFKINPRWSFGWKAMLQSDSNFSKTYAIDGFNAQNFENNIYLTGLGDRSYFDARASYYDIQSSSLTNAAEDQQAIVLPSVDYNYTLQDPVAGGELSFDVNTRYIRRRAQDDRRFATAGVSAVAGADADSLRTTVQTEWKRTFITDGGLVITPILHAQGEFAHLNDRTTGQLSSTGADLRGYGSSFRGMVTAGIELRYPILFSTTSASHVLEPVAQIFARPNETFLGGLPNEDAQSLVFDAASLFQRDKFSGYDRMEGGTRANLGLRYTGTFNNGWGIEGLFGQSIQLAGVNSFAQADTFNTGADSGLETSRSDYVAALSLTNGSNFGIGMGGRFDEQTFELRRADLTAKLNLDKFNASLGYTYIDSQPIYNFANRRHEFTTSASYEFVKDWSVFGSTIYDIQNNKLNKYTVGIDYNCDCFKMRASMTEDRTGAEISRDYKLFLSLRTLGDFGIDNGLLGQ